MYKSLSNDKRIYHDYYRVITKVYIIQSNTQPSKYNKNYGENTMTQPTWLNDEENNLKKPIEGERHPSLKMMPNKLTEITIDYTNPFPKWEGEQDGKKLCKAIIPVTFNNERMNWWLNIKNPIYAQIIRQGRAGKTTYRIIATGSQATTRYTLVD